MKETEAFEAFDWPTEMRTENVELMGTNLQLAIAALMANAITKQEISSQEVRFYRVRVSALYGDL